MKRVTPILITTISLLTAASNLRAGGSGSSGGLTLTEPFGAKPAALGEAFTAVTNDISALGYNPASLASLDSGQASFMYQRGLADDAYGHFMIGSPLKTSGWGLSVGYYNSGKMDLYLGDGKESSVTAQKDMVVTAGYAGHISNLSIGVAGKYISSELIESAKATAYAADLGLQMPVGSRLNLGGAVQNLGTKLTYLNDGDSLPRIARAGASYLMTAGKYKTTLLLDAPYYMNERQMRPAAGLEFGIGLLSLRAGYRQANGQRELSFGTGFMLGRASMDYAFGLVDQQQGQHRVSLGLKFGGDVMANSPIVRRPTTDTQVVSQAKPTKSTEMRETAEVQSASDRKLSLQDLDRRGSVHKRMVYTVQPGDTLGKIAKKMYGDSREWKKIYAANAHLLDDSRSVTAGQRIVLP